MYESYFGLRHPPFNLSPNPRCCFFNASFREAFTALSYGVERRMGLIAIMGEAGTGKTTLLETFLENAGPENPTSSILDPHLDSTAILLYTLQSFGLSERARDKLLIMQQLSGYLVDQVRKDHVVALLLDEAQGLDDEVFEGLEVLADLEYGGKKLIQIVLIGQPELEPRLQQPALCRIEQRVALRTRLGPLTSREIRPYIDFRLSAAGYMGKTPFVTQAVERIDLYSRGIPRLINVICDNALLIACAKSRYWVDEDMIEEVANELHLDGFHADRLQPSRASAMSVEFEEKIELHTITSSGRDVESKAGWESDSDENTQSDKKPIWARNRIGISWAALSVAIAAFVVVLGGANLGSSKKQGQPYILPVIDNVQRIKEVFAPIPGQIYRAFLLPSKPSQDIESLKSEMKAAAEKIENAGDDRALASEPKAKDIRRSNVSENIRRPRRGYQRTENKKPSVPPKNLLVVGNSLVRDKPSSNAEIIATLRPGTAIQLIGRTGDYLRVRSDTGSIGGYVHREDAFFQPSNDRIAAEY